MRVQVLFFMSFFKKDIGDMPPFHEMEGFFAKKNLTFFGSMKGNA